MSTDHTATRSAIASIPLADRALLADAVEALFDHHAEHLANWNDYERLLDALRTTTTGDLRVAVLDVMAEDNTSAGWDEYIVDHWIRYTGDGHGPMTAEQRSGFIDYVLQRGQGRPEVEWLVDRLAAALEQIAERHA